MSRQDTIAPETPSPDWLLLFQVAEDKTWFSLWGGGGTCQRKQANVVVYISRPRWTLEGKQEDHKLIRRFCLKEQQQKDFCLLPRESGPEAKSIPHQDIERR